MKFPIKEVALIMLNNKVMLYPTSLTLPVIFLLSLQLLFYV